MDHGARRIRGVDDRPAGAADGTDDTIIDGGNSWYRDDVDRAERMRAGFGINYLDVGTSGGIHGLERGCCLMVGGDATAVDRMASASTRCTRGRCRRAHRGGPATRGPSGDGCTAGRPGQGTS